MNFSRRSLLTLGLGGPPAPPRPAPPSAAPRPVLLRPPGALAEEAFLQRCTGCTDCITACPRLAIKRAGSELGEAVEGTPVIVPGDQPCWLCRDLPCITACNEGALLPLESPSHARLGSIHIRQDACFAAQGNICESCAEGCPTQPKALRVPHGEAPVLDAELCTGCGVCAWLCPARAIDPVGPPGL